MESSCALSTGRALVETTQAVQQHRRSWRLRWQQQLSLHSSSGPAPAAPVVEGDDDEKGHRVRQEVPPDGQPPAHVRPVAKAAARACLDRNRMSRVRHFQLALWRRQWVRCQAR